MEYIFNGQNCLLGIANGKEISFHEANIVNFSISSDRICIALRLSNYINNGLSSYFACLSFNDWKSCEFDYDDNFSKDDWFDDSILSILKDDTGFQIGMEFLWTIHITTDTPTLNIESVADFSDNFPRFEMSEELVLETKSKNGDYANTDADLPRLICSVSNRSTY